MEYDVCCLVHGKKQRAEFQFVLNSVRKDIKVKSLNFANAKSIVCCCKKDKNESSSMNESKSCDDEVEKVKIEDFLSGSELQDAMESVLQMESISEKVKVILNKWNKRSPDPVGHILYGNSRIAGLIILCQRQNYTLLMNSNTPEGYEVCLPIDQKLLGIYFGKKGRNIRELCEKNHFVVKAVDQPSSGKETHVKVFCRAEKLEEVKNLLSAKAKMLNNRGVSTGYKKRQLLAGRRHRCGRLKGVSNSWSVLSTKELAQHKFSKRYQSHLRSVKIGRTKPSRPNGSKCFHCHVTYEERKSQPGCRHHPGYMDFKITGRDTQRQGVKCRWSCCKIAFSGPVDLAEGHRDSGCVTRLEHLWRRTK